MVQNASSTITGGATTLGVRTVDEKVAYTRIQSEWIWTKTTYTNPSFTSGPSKRKDFICTKWNKKSITGDCNAIKDHIHFLGKLYRDLRLKMKMALDVIDYLKASANNKEMSLQIDARDCS